jgi:hypothetical protein
LAGVEPNSSTLLLLEKEIKGKSNFQVRLTLRYLLEDAPPKSAAESNTRITGFLRP